MNSVEVVVYFGCYWHQDTINKAEEAEDRLHRREAKVSEVDEKIRHRKTEIKNMNSKFDAVVRLPQPGSVLFFYVMSYRVMFFYSL